MFTRILVPLDGSAIAERAIGRASVIAQATDATLDLVLAHEEVLLGAVTARQQEGRREREAHYLADRAREVTTGTGVPATFAVLEGAITDAICKRAWETQADLIVMTSHGRTGWSRAWLGSVADGVLRRSSIPVLLLRAPRDEGARGAERQSFQHILLPTDGSAVGSSIIDTAVALATTAKARITVLRVVDPVPQIFPDGGLPYTAPMTIPDEEATRVVVNEVTAESRPLVERIEHAGAHATLSVIVSGYVAAAIIEFATAHGCDLIAMSTHGRGASRLAFGSIADKVLRGTELPLLIHRPASAEAATH